MSKGKSAKENSKPPTPKKISAQATPEKKRQSKLRMKEEQQSSGKKMADKDFKKFLEDVQVAAVSSVPMPKMKENNASSKGKAAASAMAGSKRPAAKATTQKSSAAQASKRSRK